MTNRFTVRCACALGIFCTAHFGVAYAVGGSAPSAPRAALVSLQAATSGSVAPSGGVIINTINGKEYNVALSTHPRLIWPSAYGDE